MTSPADADAPAPAQGDADSAWGTKFALGLAGFILVVLFVLPGFLAAGFSRTGLTFISVNGLGWRQVGSGWGYYGLPVPARIRAEAIVLAPAMWLMEHSESIRRFYHWEFELAGGLELNVES